MKKMFPYVLLISVLCCLSYALLGQVVPAQRTGFSWITTEEAPNPDFNGGYSFYAAAFPMQQPYPGASLVQTGLASCWMSTLPTGNEPEDFYTTIEGGLGWWHDTRFGTETPKFIMGGVSYNFHSWANGPGAGQSDNLTNGQRDWSESGGKYGIAQLSPNLLWPPDGLNMAQGMNGELLGYGYLPLPLTEVIEETAGSDIRTGNQCWTLFFNASNFKGPTAFFLPTFWTEPVLEDASIEGLFLDTRPAELLGFGVEQATLPALISTDDNGNEYAKISPLHFPATNDNRSMLLDQIKLYSYDALWNGVEDWFSGGTTTNSAISDEAGTTLGFTDNGGFIAGEISRYDANDEEYPIDIEAYINTYQTNNSSMGFEWNVSQVSNNGSNFVLPEYFKLNNNEEWSPINAAAVPPSTNLTETTVPTDVVTNPQPYLTPLEPDCHWQDPDGPWNNPGPSAGPFTADLGDGTTVTYYWYKFIEQPAIVHANLSENHRAILQERVEKLHQKWKHTDEYLAPPSTGSLATMDPGLIVQPPIGMEIGYVPIVTRQEKSRPKVKVFILAGQSNMQGYGTIEETIELPGTLVDVLENDDNNDWSELGAPDNWTTLSDVWLHFDAEDEEIREQLTIGQGAFSELIGPELMFGHQIDDCFDAPILIIKTAYGGKSLAVDFRPPSAGGITGESYNDMINTVNEVTQNLATEFPEIGTTDFEIAGFCWFQGWNDGESEEYMNEYESNLRHLISDVRNDLNVPDLPVVIANSGHGGFDLSDDLWVRGIQTTLVPAQETVGCDDAYEGSVGYVDTRPFYIESDQSPEEAIHHFHNNALTVLNIGKAMGIRMKEAMASMAFCEPIVSTEEKALEAHSVLIYPNPTKNRITIENAVMPIAKVILFDVNGKMLNTLEDIHQTKLNVAIPEPIGVYFLKVVTEDGQASMTRVLKIH